MKHSKKKIKKLVQERYAHAAETSCSCCDSRDNHKSSGAGRKHEDYMHIQGYVPEADLNLGCGIPTQFSDIRPGQTVVDLGSGAGNDVFIARKLTGSSGRLIGIDMTPAMIDKAELNRRTLGFDNVEFRLGDIEKIPLQENMADVVISNCVLNLVPDKEKAFHEIYRILKPGGHFCISDIVSTIRVPEHLTENAALYTGCVSGALQKEDYLKIIRKSGFQEVEIRSEKSIEIPVEFFRELAAVYEKFDYNTIRTAFRSVTITGNKYSLS